MRHHLRMSDTAQKRDIAEPRTVRDFARAVRTRRRLDLLTVLTVCDIRAVGPGVWNNWKAQLLRTLHRRTALALEEGLEAVGREGRESEAKAALEAALADWGPEAVATELGRHYGPYWQGLQPPDHLALARLLRDLPPGEIRMEIAADEGHDATRARFAMVDHPGIFSRLAGAVALAGANVVDARTYTTRDGCAVAVFWLQDAEGHPFEASRLPRLRASIERILAGEIVAAEALAPRDRVPRRERAFERPHPRHLRQRGLGHLHHRRGGRARPPRAAARPDARARRRQRPHRARRDRHLRRAGRRQLLRQGQLRAEAALGESRREGLERRLRAAIERGAERARR